MVVYEIEWTWSRVRSWNNGMCCISYYILINVFPFKQQLFRMWALFLHICVKKNTFHWISWGGNRHDETSSNFVQICGLFGSNVNIRQSILATMICTKWSRVLLYWWAKCKSVIIASMTRMIHLHLNTLLWSSSPSPSSSSSPWSSPSPSSKIYEWPLLDTNWTFLRCCVHSEKVHVCIIICC